MHAFEELPSVLSHYMDGPLLCFQYSFQHICSFQPQRLRVSLLYKQAVPFDILKKTQGEKAQNSRKKLNNSRKNWRFGQIFYIVIKSYILVTFACFMDKALVFIFTKERCFQNFIFSSKTQGNANYNVQILNYLLKSQGKNSFFGESIIPFCRN